MLIQYCYTVFIAITLLPVAHALPEPLVIFFAASGVMVLLFICCGIGGFFFCPGQMVRANRRCSYGHCHYDPVVTSALNQEAMQHQRLPRHLPRRPAPMVPVHQYRQQQYPVIHHQAPDSQSFQITHEPQLPTIPPPNLPYPPNPSNIPYPPTQTRNPPYPNPRRYKPTAPPPPSEVKPPTYSEATTQEKKY